MNATQGLPSRGIPGGLSMQSAMPVVVFLVVHRLAGLRWAVIAATAFSVRLVIERRRKGIPLGRFMPIVTAAVLVRGAIGAITGDETLYFGLGIATKFVVGAVLAGSVLIGRPLAAKGAPHVLVLSPAMQQHRIFHSTMAIITGIGALYYCISGTVDIWLFRRTDVEGFVLLRFVTNWPLSTVTIIAILAVAQARLQKIPGISSVIELIEARLSMHLSTGEAGS